MIGVINSLKQVYQIVGLLSISKISGIFSLLVFR